MSSTHSLSTAARTVNTIINRYRVTIVIAVQLTLPSTHSAHSHSPFPTHPLHKLMQQRLHDNWNTRQKRTTKKTTTTQHLHAPSSHPPTSNILASPPSRTCQSLISHQNTHPHALQYHSHQHTRHLQHRLPVPPFPWHLLAVSVN